MTTTEGPALLLGSPAGLPLPQRPTLRPPVRRLAAGVVAHNEQENLETAVASLLDQRLPEGVAWGEVWVVVSGCTDRTAEIAGRLASQEPRLRVLVDPQRRGKAHALRAVFERARGDALVLLNGDAAAGPDAVEALLDRARALPADRPYAVMARPVPRPPSAGPAWQEAVTTLWELHHDYHAILDEQGGNSHLSDELLLLGLPVPFDLPDGTVNDGSFIGVWMAQRNGCLGYAPSALVRIAAPSQLRDHLRQRRRIHFGNLEVAERLGAFPSTLAGASLRAPTTLLRVLGRQPRHRRPTLLGLAALDVLSWALALWDRLPPSRSYVRWPRIRAGAAPGRGGALPPGGLGSHRATDGRPRGFAGRIELLSAVSEEFGVRPSVAELLALLPGDAPDSAEALTAWLADHPVGRPPPERPESRGGEAARRERGERYLRRAEALFDGPLRRTHRWVRCVAVSGSVAYGTPEEGDDLDFFVVTRPGAVWWFLAYVLAVGRLARLRGPIPGEPTLCFNRVVDEREAVREFTGARDLLFAREALSVRPVHGADYYRGLLGEAGWIEELLPRMYVRPRGRSALRPGGQRAPLAVRLLNALVYLPLSGYLQFAGLRRNRRFARDGRADRAFRTETRFARHTVASSRFERLRAMYEEETRWAGPQGSSAPMAPPEAAARPMVATGAPRT